MARKVLQPVPAKAVRSYFKETAPETLPESAVKSINGRGRLHPDAVATFNEAHVSEGVEYVEGARETVEVPYKKTSKSGATLKRTVRLPIGEVRALAGNAAGERGRLSATALWAAGEAYAKSL